MKMDVMPGWDGYAIAGGGTEAPVAQYGDDPLVDSVAQALDSPASPGFAGSQLAKYSATRMLRSEVKQEG